MLPLVLGGLSFAGSLLGGIGGAQAAKKQAKMQAVQDMIARQENERMMNARNAKAEELGRELLTIPEEHTTGSWVDVDGMMAAAERSGFNPVTFLQNGGMSAYTNTWKISTGHNAADAFKMMMPEIALAQASQVPQQQSMLSAFGGALSAGASAFGTQYRADQSYDLQMGKLLQGAANQGMGLSSSNGLTAALQYGGSGGISRSGSPSSSGALTDLPYPQKWKMEEPQVTNPWYRGFIDSKSPDAAAYEDRYGEPGELVFGLRNIVNDTVRNVTGRGPEEWGTAAGMNIGSYKKPGDTSWGPSFSRWWSSPTSLPGYLRSAPTPMQNYGYAM